MAVPIASTFRRRSTIADSDPRSASTDDLHLSIGPRVRVLLGVPERSALRDAACLDVVAERQVVQPGLAVGRLIDRGERVHASLDDLLRLIVRRVPPTSLVGLWSD